jgi:hypothetical protein
LVIVGAEAFSPKEIAELRRRGQSTGRLSVDGSALVPSEYTIAGDVVIATSAWAACSLTGCHFGDFDSDTG